MLLAGVLLVMATMSGWVETPLQGVIRGYAYPIHAHLSPEGGLANRPAPLSYALLIGLVLAVTAGALCRALPGWLIRHAAACLVVGVLATPAILVGRGAGLLEALAEQDRDREAIRHFARLVGTYSAQMPTLRLPGTATLADSLFTVVRSLGYGWWLALVAAIILLLGGWFQARPRRATGYVLGWTVLGLTMLGLMCAPAVLAERQRLRAATAYARGDYALALDLLPAAEAWQPALRDNPGIQRWRGAALYWLGRERAPAARFFVAENLAAAGEFERAEFELRLALAAVPDWQLARRRLARLHVAWGLELLARGLSGSVGHWERAAEIDGTAVGVWYFLAFQHHRLDGKAQARALAYGVGLIARTRDKVLLSDAYALLGDCYFAEGRDEEARRMYRLSLAMITHVQRLNLHAQEGLLGL